jgi:hypothetical protein
MIDHCGQGLFHHIAWQNCPIQIITVGVPGYIGIREYLLDIPDTPSPDQQFSRATILAYDRQVAVVRHYPHLILSLFFYAFVRGGACGDDGGGGIRSINRRDNNSERTVALCIDHGQQLGIWPRKKFDLAHTLLATNRDLTSTSSRPVSRE